MIKSRINIDACEHSSIDVKNPYIEGKVENAKKLIGRLGMESINAFANVFGSVLIFLLICKKYYNFYTTNIQMNHKFFRKVR